MTRRSKVKKTVRKRYSQEFKEEALALAERLGVPAAARELSLHESQLYGWRVKARAERDQHMMISIPPKYAVSQVVGFIKGKSAIHIARTYIGRKRNYVGQHFWARGYFASTVGRDEQVIREYIRHQEEEDRRVDQLELV